MLTSINVKTPTPEEDMKPWIMIDPPPCFTVGMTCLGSYAVQVNNFQKNIIVPKSRAEASVSIQEIINFKVFITNLSHFFFRNKTFLFVKKES